MTLLTAGANVPLGVSDVVVSVALGGPAEAAAVLVALGGRARSGADFVPAGGGSAPAGLAWSPGDGVGAWRLRVDVAELGPDVEKVCVVASLPEGAGTFEQRAPVQVGVDAASGGEVASFVASGAGPVSSVVLVELYVRGGVWKVRALGQGYAGGRVAMLADHGLDALAVPALALAPPSETPAAGADPGAAGEATAAGSSTSSGPGISYVRTDRARPEASQGAPEAAPPPPPPVSTPAPDAPAVSDPAPAAPVSYQRADRAAATAPAPAPTAAAPTPEPVAPAPARLTDPFRAHPAGPAPVVTGPQPLWDAVEAPTAGRNLVRPVPWQLDGVEFSWTERVRDHLPDTADLPPGVDRFAVAQQWSQELVAEHGSGFEYVWRGPGGRRVSPDGVTLSTAMYEPVSGRVVAAGRLTHRELGLAAAYDVGALNGANGLSWPQDGHTDGLFYPVNSLYIGSTRTGAFVPVDSTSNYGAVDLDPVTGTVAVLEQLGTAACITVFDGSSGRRRRLTMVTTIGGYEPLRFSPDGRWLLLPRYDGAHLCEVATGRTMRLPVTNCCWWPLADSMLLEISTEDGPRVPRLFSLETGTFVHDFPAITFPGEADPGVVYVGQPEASPDGTELLVLTPAGVSAQHRERHGAGGHLARVSLADGRGHLVVPAMVDVPFPAERDARVGRWSGPFPYRQVRLAPELQEQLVAGVTEHDYLAPDRYGPEGAAFLVASLNRCISLLQSGQDASPVMPEVIVSMVAARSDPAGWETLSDWVGGVAQAAMSMIGDGALSGRAQESWFAFAVAYRGLAETGTSPITSLNVAWARH